MSSFTSSFSAQAIMVILVVGRIVFNYIYYFQDGAETKHSEKDATHSSYISGKLFIKIKILTFELL